MTWDSIRRRAGMGLAAAFGLLALLPAYWAAGGTWGLMEAMGTPEPFHPPAWLMWLTSACLAAWMAVVLGAVDVWRPRMPRRFFTVACWVITVALLVVALDYFQSPQPWERSIAAPVMLLMGIAAMAVARGGSRTRTVFP